jgi:hypothetical protein
MKQTPRPSLLCMFIGAAGLLACEASSSLGSAGAPENYQVRSVDPGAGIPQTVAAGADESVASPAGVPLQPLVRLTQGDGMIRNIAVTDEYLYFATWWEGVYRLPRYGSEGDGSGAGPLEVIEAGAKNLFEPLTTSQHGAFWVRSRYDDRDYPSVEVKRRDDAGGSLTTLFSGDWGVTTSNEHSNFQVDATGVYMIAGPAGALNYHLFHVPAGGGPITQVLELPERWPTWLVDDGQLFFADCASARGADCPIRVMPASGGPARLLGSLPTADAMLAAVDRDALYLQGIEGIWKMAKADGAVSLLLRTEGGARSSRFLVVDDARLYFTAQSAAGFELRMLDKGATTSVLLTRGDALSRVMQVAQGPRVLYLLHDDGRRISVIAKP